MRVLVLAAAAPIVALASAAQAQNAPQPVTRSAMSAQLDGAFTAADTNHDGSPNLAGLQALEGK